MHYSVSTMFFHEYPVAEVFDLISLAGFDSIEFWPETPDFWLRDQPPGELADCLANHPEFSQITLHTPILDLNPCSVNPRVACVSVEYALSSLALAQEVGASVFVVHPGRRTAKRVPSAADYDRFDSFIGKLQEAALGGKVKVAIENMEPAVNSLLCTPEGVRELLDREPWLYFTLDVSHASKKSAGEPYRYIDLCGDRMVNVHMSRMNGDKLHLPMARHPDSGKILARLRELHYPGNLTLEIEDRNFTHDLSSEEKILVLMEELSFAKECTAQSLDL